ncbi:MAG: glycoside hydrolase family 3 C-terminal domain-containing protein [Ignavibacteria bacterium]|nr:glycoside hydrolase family 3 C-terminal domain-containing protein [Ignavibacteria bacterium]
MKSSLKYFLISILLFTLMGSKDNDKPPYKNPKLPVDQRVEDLLKRMTLDEKIVLIGGNDLATFPNERLGIPELRMSDGPLGVRMEKSVAFPSGINLGATWNPELVAKIGKALGRELKGHDRHVLLAPCVNIARIPNGGRNFESFGEDPFLTSRMAVDYIKGLQSEGVAATVKHYAANNQEHERMFVDVQVSERALNEIYLPAFKAAVQEAGTICVMNAYNKVNGHFASENDYLLNKILKTEWGFSGLVMSDWGAVHSSIPTANGVMDLEMPYGKYLNKDSLLPAIQKGEVKESSIDEKVRRILKTIFRLGLFEKPSLKDGYKVGAKENREAAFLATREGIVLLKNESNILPLNFSKIKSLAVLGPNAAKARTGGGGSSQVEPIKAPSPLEILKKNFGNKIKIDYAAGVKLDGETVPVASKYLLTKKGEEGLLGEYFDNKELTGKPAYTRVDKKINFDWGGDSPFKKENWKEDNFSARWTGKVKAPVTGTFIFDLISDDGVRFYFDDNLVIDHWTDHAPESREYEVKLIAGKEYNIKIEYYENGGGAVCKFGWTLPGEDPFQAAIRAAKESEVVVLFAGTSNAYESEGFDRKDLVLPKNQDELIEKVAEVNKNVIVVINAGSPVLMDKWLGKVKGVVFAWFGGQEMSYAISDILSGKFNPSGKLPITFPKRWEDCSAFSSYKQEDSVTKYTDGIFVGYRHFEHNKIEPLFPFGFGLSYTNFAYGKLKLSADEMNQDGKINLTFEIKNVGIVAGSEIPQLYVRDIKSSVERPVKELKGFTKIFLKPGETKPVTFTVDKSALSFYDVTSKSFVAEAGEFEILIGSSSEKIELKDTFVLK